MTDVAALIGELKENYDVEYWGALLDTFDQRLADLHKKIDGSKYTEWGLLALKATEGSEDAQALLPSVLEPGSEDKKILDEMALLYLIQPVLRHHMFRASNRRQEMGPPSG